MLSLGLNAKTQQGHIFWFPSHNFCCCILFGQLEIQLHVHVHSKPKTSSKILQEILSFIVFLTCTFTMYLFFYSKTSERCTKPLNRMKLLKALSWMRGNGLLKYLHVQLIPGGYLQYTWQGGGGVRRSFILGTQKNTRA